MRRLIAVVIILIIVVGVAVGLYKLFDSDMSDSMKILISVVVGIVKLVIVILSYDKLKKIFIPEQIEGDQKSDAIINYNKEGIDINGKPIRGTKVVEGDVQ